MLDSVMAKTIALVGCVKTKQPVPMPARDLYSSDLFKKASTYADKIADEWYILSAEYGLIHPNSVIKPYDKTCKDMRTIERKKWANKVLEDLLAQLTPGCHIVILAPECYRHHLIGPLRAMGYSVTTPMQGLGIGEQLHWLKEKLLDP